MPLLEGGFGNGPLSSGASGLSQDPYQQRPECPWENPLCLVQSLYLSACVSSLLVSLLCSFPPYPSPFAARYVPKFSIPQVPISSSLVLQTLGSRDIINNCPHISVCIWNISKLLMDFYTCCTSIEAAMFSFSRSFSFLLLFFGTLVVI